MLNSIVHIESSNKQNKSFGTGFVIDNDEHGAYILTCQHVLDEVQIANIEEKEVEIIATSDFLDMAIIFAPSLKSDKMNLQLKACNSLNISSIAFSSFQKDLVQKSTIHATLFKDFIELHSTEDETFYLIKKIKADPDYRFSKGNSGAPIICNQSKKVIAMLSNREGQNIGYAIGVSSLKKLLVQLREDSQLFTQHEDFYNRMSSFKKEVNSSIKMKKNIKNRAIYHINELKKEKANIMKVIKEKSLKLKYFFLGTLAVFALYGAYSFWEQRQINNNDYYRVTNVPSTQTLNVRKGEGRGYPIIYELSFNTTNILVSRCKKNDDSQRWCKIKYRNIRGWVHSHYITKVSN